MSGPHRISIVGTSGSGKTSLARRAAGLLGVPHVELDAIFHLPGWTELPEAEFRVAVAALAGGPGWVIDGNYGAVRDLVWGRADQIVFLDYERALVMRRVIRRSVARALDRRPMWNGNREDAREWIRAGHPIRWAWSTHGERRLSYRATAAGDHRVVLLRTPRDAEAWLARLATSARGAAC